MKYYISADIDIIGNNKISINKGKTLYSFNNVNFGDSLNLLYILKIGKKKTLKGFTNILDNNLLTEKRSMDGGEVNEAFDWRKNFVASSTKGWDNIINSGDISLIGNLGNLTSDVKKVASAENVIVPENQLEIAGINKNSSKQELSFKSLKNVSESSRDIKNLIGFHRVEIGNPNLVRTNDIGKDSQKSNQSFINPKSTPLSNHSNYLTRSLDNVFEGNSNSELITKGDLKSKDGETVNENKVFDTIGSKKVNGILKSGDVDGEFCVNSKVSLDSKLEYIKKSSTASRDQNPEISQVGEILNKSKVSSRVNSEDLLKDKQPHPPLNNSSTKGEASSGQRRAEIQFPNTYADDKNHIDETGTKVENLNIKSSDKQNYYNSGEGKNFTSDFIKSGVKNRDLEVSIANDQQNVKDECISKFTDVPRSNFSSIPIGAAIQKITRTIISYATGQTTHTKFLINGGNFGKLEIRFSETLGDDKTAVIFVESDKTRSLLLDWLPVIAENLSQKGIRFDSLDVMVNDFDFGKEKPSSEDKHHSRKDSSNNNVEVNIEGNRVIPYIHVRNYGYNTIEILA